jgi:DNA replication protein DnaC
VERVLTLDFLAQPENVIVVAPHGLGKTMIAKSLVHEAIVAGHSARFLTAADLILDLTRQETARALQHRLRSYLRPTLLAIDEVGYLAYDAHAADLLFQVVSRRYEQMSIVITTNRLCGAPHNRFNAEPMIMRSLVKRGPATTSFARFSTPHYGSRCQRGD